LLKILNIFWTDSEHYSKFWTLLKILSRFWTWVEATNTNSIVFGLHI
jgi:hypothetical protein